MYTELSISVLLEGCSHLSLRLCLLNFWNMALMNKKLYLQGWPVNDPDIVVSTPAALLNNIDPNKFKFRRMEFTRSVKYVVSFCFIHCVAV